MSKNIIPLTAERLRELLHYDPETGVFTWRQRRGGAAKEGCRAGARKNRYRLVYVDGCKIYEHRLAWFYVHGVWPPEHIDHIDGVGTNNSIHNLRPVSRALNLQNQRGAQKGSRSGLLGVDFQVAAQKWRARIQVNGRHIHIGLFASPEHAYAAYLAKKRAVHATCCI